jgi:hypothetical protein
VVRVIVAPSAVPAQRHDEDATITIVLGGYHEYSFETGGLAR